MRPQRAPHMKPYSSDSVPVITSRDEAHHVQRFDGINKTSEKWDRLRRDEELWSHDGDCVVHLCAPNTSRRGPSLRIPLKVIEQTDSQYLVQECLHKRDTTSPGISEDDNSDSGYGGSTSSNQCSELYIPAPAYATRQEAHTYHLTTRNFFAYLLDVPLVGETLGEALAQLWKRTQIWQPSDMADSDLRVYCKEQGYFSYVENFQYALATLYLVEQTRSGDMWSEAFVHCVGMHDRLQGNEDYAKLSGGTKVLLAQAAMDMKAHTTRVTKSLGTFLEDDLGPENLGLSKPMRCHLDRFRSALHSFYVHEINGYFPPDDSDPWGKRLWHSMYGDFHSLYVYLADMKSSGDGVRNLGAHGGICVAQSLQAFNARHDFSPLPYTLPLLPNYRPCIQEPMPEVRRGLGSLRIGRLGTAISQRPTARQALSTATNNDNRSVRENRLVQEYMRFESLGMEEKVTVTEARKVRWLLVYSTLQLLISITKAPVEVRGTERPSYPLCVLDTACPTWPEDQLTGQSSDDHAAQYLANVEAVRKSCEEDRISIHPDCEASCAADYFSMNTVSRSESIMSSESLPSSPTGRNSTLSRTASIRSSVSTLHRSVVGSLARRNSQRRGSIIASPTKSPVKGTFCETLYELQGSEVEEISPVDSIMGFVDSAFEATKPASINKPETTQQDHDALASEMYQVPVARNAVPVRKLRHTSGLARYNRHKPKPRHVDCGYPAGEAVPVDLPQKLASELGALGGFEFDFDAPQNSTEPEPELPAMQHVVQDDARPRSRWANIALGSYTPTGAFITKSRDQSVTSLTSMASYTSSIHPENSQQADEIAEHDVRRRGLLRGLDRLRGFALVDVK